MIRDFNEIQGHHEKEKAEGAQRAPFLHFTQMLSDCEILKFTSSGNMILLDVN